MKLFETIVHEKQYQERLLHWQFWLDKADELVTAARLLEPEIKRYWENAAAKQIGKSKKKKSGITRYPLLQDIHFMLIAYAIENYLKAAILRTDSDKLANEIKVGKKSVPEQITTHDLYKLAKDVGLKPNADEEELLIRLYQSSTWRGRYPVPANREGLRSIQKTADGKPHFTAYLSLRDVSRINDLLILVKQYVKKRS